MRLAGIEIDKFKIIILHAMFALYTILRTGIYLYRHISLGDHHSDAGIGIGALCKELIWEYLLINGTFVSLHIIYTCSLTLKDGVDSFFLRIRGFFGLEARMNPVSGS